ncbi:hypothetical protein ACFW0L_25170 [Priestia megaterium]|uniref:tetratricopeptide repeat protein n=1 Tax=Priestia megaterium TaxID=1404 RepID=UPI00366C097A
MRTNSLIDSAKISDTRFQTDLKIQIQKTNYDELIQEFCSWLFFYTESTPKKSEKICRILLQELNSIPNQKYNLICMAYCCLLKALIELNDSQNVFKEYKIALRIFQDHNLSELGEEIIDTMLMGFEKKGLFQLEVHTAILREAIYFFNHFNKYSHSITLMIAVAQIFSGFRAFSSAYRILIDAEKMALKENLSIELAKIHSASGLVAYNEHDFENAKNAFESAISIYHNEQALVPEEVMINLATSYMQLKFYEKAASLYESILNNDDFQKQHINVIYLNLVVCFRRLKDFKKAIEYYDKIDKDFFEKNLDPENKIEFFLISSNTFSKMKDFKSSLDFLIKAINTIDQVMGDINRFHYRRGFREKYFSRILGHLIDLTEPICINQLDVEKLLQIFMYMNVNSFADWLALTDWFSTTKMKKNIDKSVIENFESIFDQLKERGAPIILGFHEKYDDPFEDYGVNKSSDFQSVSMIWNSFNTSLQKLIDKGNLNPPYIETNSFRIARKVTNKYLNEKTFLLFSYYTNEKIFFFYIVNKKLTRFEVPINNYLKFLATLTMYQRKETTLLNFKSSLTELINSSFGYFSNLIDQIVDLKPDTILNFSDNFLHLFPVISIFNSDEKVRKIISDHGTNISSIPILYESKESSYSLKTYSGIFEPFKELPLLHGELGLSKSVSSIFRSTEIINLRINEQDINLKNTDFIHIASHGFPISSYTDPFLSTISGPNSTLSFSFQDIQREFYHYNYQVVFLSMCDSSNYSNRNFFKDYKTNENIGFPSLFLLNAKSIVISINWPILDIIPFVFTYYLFTELNITSNIERAFNKTLVNLCNMNKLELIKILNYIPDSQLREKKKRMFENMDDNYLPFKDPYIYGAFTLSKLL